MTATLAGRWISPVTGAPLAWDAGAQAFVSAGGERFGCLAGDLPDFRPGAAPLPAEEVAAVRARLDAFWHESEVGPEPPDVLVPASPAETRRYWWLVARAEAQAFAGWWLRGRPAYTQDASMAQYRDVTDVYPNAVRRPTWVLADGRVARTSLMGFKRRSLAPVLELIRREGVRSVLDFGCGWGANAILLARECPEVETWAFDLSPYRVLATQLNLERLGLQPYRLFVADGSRLPLPDGAVDLVLTTHVLEQMAGVLPAALAEIRRVARRFAVHVEPSARAGRWPHRLRMRRYGYPRDIAERAVALGWRLLEHRPASPAWGKAPGALIVLAR